MFFLSPDHREEIEHMKSKYKDEKQENKKLKVKIEHLEEEVQEIKHEKESSEKVDIFFCYIYLMNK